MSIHGGAQVPVLLAGVLTEAECAELRALAAGQQGHDDDGHGEGHADPSLRPHRVEWLAGRLSVRLAAFVPGATVDPRCRLYRLGPGDGVPLHRDADYAERGRTARWSVLVCLSVGHGGGETEFPGLDPSAVPRCGLGDALVFPHALVHGASPVTTGERHVLKTDVFGPAVHVWRGDRRGQASEAVA